MELEVHAFAAGARGVGLAPRAAPQMLVPIEAAVVEVEAGSERHALDRSSFLIMPPQRRLRLRSTVPASRLAVLRFASRLFDEVQATYGVLGFDARRLERWMAAGALLPRTVWVHEIVHRYVFEEHALGELDADAARFLEREMVKELFYLFRDRESGADRAPIARRFSAGVERALGFLEAHLFEPVGMDVVAGHAGMSDSTLLRAFRRELGCTPAAYGRGRRLDEALVLLRQGSSTVAEVSALVGYDNATAFAHAFRARFGRPPSAFQPRGPVRRAP